MILSGWGRFPTVEASAETIQDSASLAEKLAGGFVGITRGFGRSYGDSSLAPRVLLTRALDNILGFDSSSGIVTCQAGVSLADLLTTFVPRGWFQPVTPGTKFVCVGGAIASDVHGKNHHHAGCFCASVLWLRLMLPDGTVAHCSPHTNARLFRATCGGMGLTGVILEARIRMRPIESTAIHETIIKAVDLDDVLRLFESHNDAEYSVAWVDCLAKGKSLGRSLLMVGEHATAGLLELRKTTPMTMGVDTLGLLLNRYSVAAFNCFYYHRLRQREARRRVHYECFFYPLDRIHEWNRMYGRRGFVQYQLVVPRADGNESLSNVLERVSAAGRGPFLAVLKLLGAQNRNPLSFPMEGYTLALDFKMDSGLLDFLEDLDRLVANAGGRLYLTKDARMPASLFKESYPQWEGFLDVRESVGARGVFESLQSRRLGL